MDAFDQSATNTSQAGIASAAREDGASNVRTPPLAAIFVVPVAATSASVGEYTPSRRIVTVAFVYCEKKPLQETRASAPWMARVAGGDSALPRSERLTAPETVAVPLLTTSEAPLLPPRPVPAKEQPAPTRSEPPAARRQRFFVETSEAPFTRTIFWFPPSQPFCPAVTRNASASKT